jgi:hypothetical protein
MGAVTNIEPDEHRGQGLDDSGIGKWTTIDESASGYCLDESASAFTGPFIVSTNDDIAVDLVTKIGKHRGGDILKRGDYLGLGGQSLCRLFSGGTSPDSKDAGRPATDGRFERNGNVDEERPWSNGFADLFERRNLGGKWNGQDDHRAGSRGLKIPDPANTGRESGGNE